MPELSRPLWAIRIKAARKVHLAEADEERPGPRAITLCRKSYVPADRASGATKSKQIDPLTCQACLRKSGYIDPAKQLLTDMECMAKALSNLNLSSEDFTKIFKDLLKARAEAMSASA